MQRRAVLSHHLRGLLGPAETPSDADLLARFADRRDEDAFAELVRRHGPMVLGVCRRVLGNPHDADDAFQATFLVLARKAAAVRRSCPTPAGWLHGVANRTALKSRRAAAVRRAREATAAGLRDFVFHPTEPAADLRGALDAVLAGLPDRYRLAVVLCDLEGLPRREAAGRLGWTEGTLSGRLARARSLLARRLAKYGPGVAGAAPAAVLPALVESTARAAVLVAAGQTAAGVVPAAALELSHGVVNAMFVSKLKIAAAGLMVVTAVAWTGAAGSWSTAAAGPQDAPAGKTAAGQKKARDAEADRVAQLERERDELRRKLADALDRLIALEAQVKEERVARERAEAARLTPPGAAQPGANPFTPLEGATDLPRPAGKTALGNLGPPALQPRGGMMPPGSAAGPASPGSGLPPGGGYPGMARPAPATPLVLKVYRVDDLAADEKQSEAVVRVIRSLVEPESWTGSGGSGVVEYLVTRKVLLVRQTEPVHEQIAALVRLLLEQSDAPRKTTGSPRP